MRYILLSFSVIVFFAACSKKDKTPSYANVLRTGKWKLASGTLTVRNPNGKDTVLNYLNFIPDCYKDDYLVFDSLNSGRRYNGTNRCSAAEGEYVAFTWGLKNNNTQIDLYNGFNNIYGVVDTIQPWHYNVLNSDPNNYVVDTVIGRLDTLAGYIRTFIEVDTVRELRFTGVPAGIGADGVSMGGYDLYGTDLSNFTQSSFTIHFQMHSFYIDSTSWHSASYLLPLDNITNTNPGNYPIVRADTFNYSLTYTNF